MASRRHSSVASDLEYLLSPAQHHPLDTLDPRAAFTTPDDSAFISRPLASLLPADLADLRARSQGSQSSRSALASSAPKRRLDSGVARKLPDTATVLLRQWLVQHTAFPYPNEDEKQELVLLTGLTKVQVSNWFINARRRSPDLFPDRVPGRPGPNSNRPELSFDELLAAPPRQSSRLTRTPSALNMGSAFTHQPLPPLSPLSPGYSSGYSTARSRSSSSSSMARPSMSPRPSSLSYNRDDPYMAYLGLGGGGGSRLL